MKLYQAEWCPFSHRVRAKLTELGIDYELVNVPASSKKRGDLEKVAGTTAIPVLVDGQNVISDSEEALSYLEKEYRAEPDELELHHRELSPTVYGTLPFELEEATERLCEALAEVELEVLQELDLSSVLGREGAYKVLIAGDLEFLRLAADANPGAATLALLKIAVYEEDGSTRVDAVEPEKGAAQIRNPQLNDRGLELRKRFIKMIKGLERANAQGHESQKS
ncbi:MAG TPA: glutathione S-transferase N-terminal domain-containing protein [Rubrobacter sp.]|nr:glutathione S-transferase N-terminal domain-containing protein [Rubrobacter sp.]